MERRLAAILAADVVGYSRLMSQDEAGTLEVLKDRRKAILAPIVKAHGGRIVKLMGDGVLAEFGSAVKAVQAAVELQTKMAEANTVGPKNGQIILRIGINLGDVIGEDDDVFGDGVNIASRLEGLAEPGGICISAKVHEEVMDKTGAEFEDTGDQLLKNIDKPVRTYGWIRKSPGRAKESFAPLLNKPSIAVLPFDNMSADPDQQYFSDGITEDIITGLARFRSLTVIARNSSFAFRGIPIDIAEIGRKLGVTYLLEGSIRRAGSRVRITAQLIEAATGTHLWADRYDRSLDDIFAVQDEVTQVIVATLFGRIWEAGLERSARKPTASLTAYECLLRGLAYYRSQTENAQRALEMFDKAIDIDPHYALAHANRALMLVTIHGLATAPVDILGAAVAGARHAIELDPQESRSHRILSTIVLYSRDYDLAELHIRRALELNPNDADALMTKGRLLAIRGKPQEGLDCLESAARLDPQYLPQLNAYFGVALYSLRRFTESLQALKRFMVIRTETRPTWALARSAACYAQLDRVAETQEIVTEVLRLQPDFSIATFMQKSVLLERDEDRELLREGLIKAAFPQ